MSRRIVIHFAGDSGDGVQLLGQRFSASSRTAANDFMTFADFPAEIRAPAGSRAGVSSYTVHFGDVGIQHAGDKADVLIALNPAALAEKLGQLAPDCCIIADAGSFTSRNLSKAGYQQNPLTDGSLSKWQVISPDISKFTLLALSSYEISRRDALQSRNMWVLGMLIHTFGFARDRVEAGIREKFQRQPEIVARNLSALHAGANWAENTEFSIPLAAQKLTQPLPKGEYRSLNGAQSLAWGIYSGCRLQQLTMFYSGYPITPASNILHTVAKLANDKRNFHVQVIQAEDEMAACCMAIGASYGGSLGVTATSGPGLDLMTESLAFAATLELPLVVINVQRAGPATGMPTKTEQSDLAAAVSGRHGEAPIPVLAATSPSDSFDMAIEATRIAVTYMTPVILLADATIANSSQPWKMPDFSQAQYQLSPSRLRVLLEPDRSSPPIDNTTASTIAIGDASPAGKQLPRNGMALQTNAGNPDKAIVKAAPTAESEVGAAVWQRDPKTLARPWYIPPIRSADITTSDKGIVTPGAEQAVNSPARQPASAALRFAPHQHATYRHATYRLGALERDLVSGAISYVPENHARQTRLRHARIEQIAADLSKSHHNYQISLADPDHKNDKIIISWGSVAGPVQMALQQLKAEQANQLRYDHLVLRYLYPFPASLSALLQPYRLVLVPEMNMGQLAGMLRSVVPPASKIVRINQVSGIPFQVADLVKEFTGHGQAGSAGSTTAAPAPWSTEHDKSNP